MWVLGQDRTTVPSTCRCCRHRLQDKSQTCGVIRSDQKGLFTCPSTFVHFIVTHVTLDSQTNYTVFSAQYGLCCVDAPKHQAKPKEDEGMLAGVRLRPFLFRPSEQRLLYLLLVCRVIRCTPGCGTKPEPHLYLLFGACNTRFPKGSRDTIKSFNRFDALNEAITLVDEISSSCKSDPLSPKAKIQ